MIPFDIKDFVRRNSEKIFSSKYTVENGKVDFYPGLIPHTRVQTGVEYLQDIMDIQNA